MPGQKKAGGKKKSSAADDDALLAEAEKAAAEFSAKSSETQRRGGRGPAQPKVAVLMVHYPANAEAAPVDRGNLDLFDACSAQLRTAASSEGEGNPFLWLRRSFAASMMGLHGEAYADFERMVMIQGDRIDLPDMKPEPAMALLRSFAAVGHFSRFDQLLPPLSQLAGLTKAQRSSLQTFAEDKRKESKATAKRASAATQHSVGGALGTPVLLCDRTAVRTSAAALAWANAQFGSSSPRVEVRVSSFGGLGVFATADIPAGTVIHTERPCFTGAGKNACDRCAAAVPKGAAGVKCGVSPSCPAVYCSDACRDEAAATFHPLLCGPAAATVLQSTAAESAVATQRFNATLIAKVFAAAYLQAKPSGAMLSARPADEAPLKYLCRKFDAERTEHDRRLTSDVWMAMPLQRGLECVVRALPPTTPRMHDPHVDFTAVSQLQQILVSNAFGDSNFVALLLGASFFNHACEPSVSWNRDAAKRGLFTFTTRRAVSKGEELTISYCQGQGAMSDALRSQYGIPAPP